MTAARTNVLIVGGGPSCRISDTTEPSGWPGPDPIELLVAVRDLLGARSNTELRMRAVYAARSVLDADAAVWAETVDGASCVRASVGLVEPQAFGETDGDLVIEAFLVEGMADAIAAPVRGLDGPARIFVLSRTPSKFTTAHVTLLAEISRIVGSVTVVISEVENLRRDAAVLDGAIRSVDAGSSIDEVARQAGVALGTEIRAELPPSAAAPSPATDDGLCVPIPHSRLALRAPGARGAPHTTILKRLAGLLGVSIAARRTEFDLELRMNGTFIEALVSGLRDRLEPVAERARLLGIDLKAPHALVTLGRDTPVERPVLDRVAARLHDLAPHGLLSTYRGHIVILWPIPAGGSSEDLRGAVSRLLDAACPSRLFAGISRVCSTLDGYRDSLRESMFSMHVARHAPGLSRVTVAQELGVFQIAAYIVGSGAEREAVERTLGRLLDADRRLKSDLVTTLRTYLVHERRAAATARALFIHPNTLRYRLEQVRENIDLDLDDADARFELLVALQLESILRSLRPDGDNSASRLGRLTHARPDGGGAARATPLTSLTRAGTAACRLPGGFGVRDADPTGRPAGDLGEGRGGGRVAGLGVDDRGHRAEGLPGRHRAHARMGEHPGAGQRHQPDHVLVGDRRAHLGGRAGVAADHGGAVPPVPAYPEVGPHVGGDPGVAEDLGHVHGSRRGQPVPLPQREEGGLGEDRHPCQPRHVGVQARQGDVVLT